MATGEDLSTVLDIVLGQWVPLQALVEAVPEYEQQLRILQRGDYDPNDRKWRHRIDRIDALNHLGSLVLVHEPIPRDELQDKSGLHKSMFTFFLGGLTSQGLVEALHPHDLRSSSSRYTYVPTDALRWGLAQPAQYPELAGHYARLSETAAPTENA